MRQRPVLEATVIVRARVDSGSERTIAVEVKGFECIEDLLMN